MTKTNFDRYLEEQMADPDFARRFERAGRDWDVALKLAALRERAGLSQKQLAQRADTTQQQISRLESPSYRGHSLRLLSKVAEALGHRVEVDFVAVRATRAAARKSAKRAPRKPAVHKATSRNA